MALDESREFVVTIDSQRSISGAPVVGSTNIVLTIEDPHSICVVEMEQNDLRELVTELYRLRVKEPGDGT